MKKLLQLVIALCLLALMPAQFASAAGSPTVELSKSKSSAPADGSSSITITVYAYFEGCTDYDWTTKQCVGEIETAPGENYTYNVSVSGSNNTHPSSVTTGADGKASFELKSTTVETKTITVHKTTTTVEFTTPVAAPAPKPKATPKPAPTPAPTPTPPTTPTASVIKTDNQAVADTEEITVQSDKVFTIGGTTVANGIVKLFIFSDPKEATVTADAQGNWTYDISGLEPGSHHVEAEVTDPATNLTSQRATLANFTVTKPPVVAVIATTSTKKRNLLPYIVAGAVVITAGAAAGIWWYLRNKRNKPTAPIESSDPPVAPSSDPTDDTSQSSSN